MLPDDKSLVHLIEVELAKPHWPSIHVAESSGWVGCEGAQQHRDYIDRLKAMRPERAHRIGDYMKHAEEVGAVLLRGLWQQEGAAMAERLYHALDATLTDARELAHDPDGDGMTVVDDILHILRSPVDATLGRLAGGEAGRVKQRAVINMSAGIFDIQGILQHELTRHRFRQLLGHVQQLVDDDVLVVRAGGNSTGTPALDTAQTGAISAGLGNVITVGVGDRAGLFSESVIGDFAVDCYTDPAYGYHATSYAAPRMANYCRWLMREFADVPSHMIKAAILQTAEKRFRPDEAVACHADGTPHWGSRSGAGYVAVPEDPRDYPTTPAYHWLKQMEHQHHAALDTTMLATPHPMQPEALPAPEQTLRLSMQQAITPFNTMLEFHLLPEAPTANLAANLDASLLELWLTAPSGLRVQLKRQGTNFTHGSLSTSAFLEEQTTGDWLLEATGCTEGTRLVANLYFSGVGA